jgi:putative addiction module killer protein
MIEVRQTAAFVQWMDSLRDRRAQARIQARIDRLSVGNFGDARSVGDDVAELRMITGLDTESTSSNAARQ